MYEVIVDRCEVTGQNGATFSFYDIEDATKFIDLCFSIMHKDYIEIREVKNAKKSN